MTATIKPRRLARPADVPKTPGYEIWSERYVRRLVDERRVRFFKLGPGRSSPVVVDLDDLDRVIEAGRSEAER